MPSIAENELKEEFHGEYVKSELQSWGYESMPQTVNAIAWACISFVRCLCAQDNASLCRVQKLGLTLFREQHNSVSLPIIFYPVIRLSVGNRRPARCRTVFQIVEAV